MPCPTIPANRSTAAAQFNSILTALLESVADAPEAPQWKPDSFFRRFVSGPSLPLLGGTAVTLRADKNFVAVGEGHVSRIHQV
jgi:hypothetical protein